MGVSLNCTEFEENELREKNLDLCIIPMDLDNLQANRDMSDKLIFSLLLLLLLAWCI